MPIRIRCIGCDRLLSVASRKAGQTIRCPACDSEIAVPESAPEESTAQPESETVDSPRPQPSEEDDDEEGGVQLRPVQSDFEEMDLTPMVDVTFLLLIFFMITASFQVHKSMEIPAPEPEEEGSTQQQMDIEDFKDASIIVTISEDNVVSVDDEEIETSSIIEKLEEKMRMDQKSELVIEANSKAVHGTVVIVVDAANEVGMQRIRLATKR